MHRGAVLLACLGIAGCGGSDEADRPQRAGDSSGLEVYAVVSQGFEIGLPPEWRVVSIERPLPEEEREQLRRETPNLAPVLQAIASGDEAIKLFAYDPEVRDDFATNVNVAAVALPSDETLDQFVAAGRSDVEGFGARASDLESEAVELPSGLAERLDYRLRITRGGREQEVATQQFLLVGGGRGYVVTFSTLLEHSDRYEQVFDGIVRSLRLD